MKVYKINPDTNINQVLVMENDNDWDKLRNKFVGETVRNDWEPVQLEIHEDSSEIDYSDFPDFSPSIIVLSGNAVNTLSTFLLNSGELLKLYPVNNIELFIFNVTNIVDALIEEKSDIKKMKSGRVLKINKYMFDPKKVENNIIFKIPQTKRSETYVTQKFVDTVRTSDLVGFKFTCIWDSEEENRNRDTHHSI